MCVWGIYIHSDRHDRADSTSHHLTYKASYSHGARSDAVYGNHDNMSRCLKYVYLYRYLFAMRLWPRVLAYATNTPRPTPTRHVNNDTEQRHRLLPGRQCKHASHCAGRTATRTHRRCLSLSSLHHQPPPPPCWQRRRLRLFCQRLRKGMQRSVERRRRSASLTSLLRALSCRASPHPAAPQSCGRPALH